MFGKDEKKKVPGNYNQFNSHEAETVGAGGFNQGGFNQGGFNQGGVQFFGGDETVGLNGTNKGIGFGGDETVGLNGGAKTLNSEDIENIKKAINGDEGKTVSYGKLVEEEKTVAMGAFTSGQNAVKPRTEPVVGWMVCTEGSEKGRDFKLFSGRSSLGRSLKCDIAVSTDPSIDEEGHVFIVYDPRSGSFFLQAGSGSCTLNGVAVEAAELLHDGDIVKCGDSTFCFIPFCKEGRKW